MFQFLLPLAEEHLEFNYNRLGWFHGYF